MYKDDEQRRVRFGFIAEDAETGALQYIKHRSFLFPELRYMTRKVKISEQNRRPSSGG